MKIRVLDIAYETMADGPGLRTSIYCAGCAHHCPGCHNPQSWDFKAGQEMSVQELLDIIKDDEFANVTYSGGDPLYQVEAFTELSRRIKEETGKTIWCYTGFLLDDELMKSGDDDAMELLSYIDVVVDGRFVEELKDATLHWKGSSNQRVIDVKASLGADAVVLH